MLKKITLLILAATVVFSCSPQTRSNRLTASRDQTSIMNGRLTEESDIFAKHVVGIIKKVKLGVQVLLFLKSSL